MVCGPVNGEQDEHIQYAQGSSLEAQIYEGHRVVGPQCSGPAAVDELRRPEGDDDGAEHDHGHGGRSLSSLEHHVKEHIDKWARLVSNIVATRLGSL